MQQSSGSPGVCTGLYSLEMFLRWKKADMVKDCKCSSNKKGGIKDNAQVSDLSRGADGAAFNGQYHRLSPVEYGLERHNHEFCVVGVEFEHAGCHPVCMS